MANLTTKYKNSRDMLFDNLVYKTYKHLPEKEFFEIRNKYLRCRDLFFNQFFNDRLTTYKYQFEICTIIITIVQDSIDDKLNTDSETEFEYSIFTKYKIPIITNIKKQNNANEKL